MMKCLAFVSFLLIAQGASAQQIFKSVDEHGNISYSSEPAKGAVKVETVEPPPAPSADEVERAQQRYRELEARDAERERQRRDEEQAELRRQQIQADLELKRRLANPSPSNVIVINQNPYYWGRVYPPLWHRPVPPRPHPMPPRPVAPKLPRPGGAPFYPKLPAGPAHR